MLSQHRLAIQADDDAQTLHDRLAKLGAEAIVAALAELAAGRARATAQPEFGATYARKLSREDSDLDWLRPCRELECQVRALRPSPGARTLLRGEPVKVWRARCVAEAGTPGEVLDSGGDGILVGCADGALLVTELQRAGGSRLPAAEFLRGFPIARGEQLGAAR